MKRIIPKIGRIRDPQTGALVQGVLIRDPHTRERLPAEGILVDVVNPYWRRRAAEEGVRIEDEPEAPPAAPAPPPNPEPQANAPAPVADSVTPSQPAPAPAPKE